MSRSAATRLVESDDDDEYGNNSQHDVVLSREDFDLLQAFHKLIPVPALASGITRVVCDEELQVGDEAMPAPGPEVDDVPEAASLSASASHVSIVRRLSRSSTPEGVLRLTKPLTKEVDLAKFTPRQPQPPRTPKRT
ncbi:hypothetical protein SDRG_09667 [Saprolegnia diclina VS20]|uniref:Uncharacterized protein n=1 Tax=Saprolegnia diclina (strain VS20) TaxID=1156394 RepID=T0RK71_SAPDV|nr:hypothetical protein SDRG_09667 [Saprolegnia diclina VS20]EQC32693.1 hypothetical protein SDRG_09667 [Saprolegnia diclina VS20]|eukprot:XP_008613837.1 hypothetical protein SDRG_09667 [Saprolegnia diclina VS20]